MASNILPARFVVVTRRGTFSSLLRAAQYAEYIKTKEPETLITVDILPTHTDPAMIARARAE